MLLVFSQRISSGIAGARNFKAVKITFVIEVFATFVKLLIPTGLVTLKKYNLVKLFKLASEFSPRTDF